MRGFARLGDARRSSDERWRLCETKSQLARSDVKARLLSGVEICRARSIGAKIREARTQLRDELTGTGLVSAARCHDRKIVEQLGVIGPKRAAAYEHFVCFGQAVFVRVNARQ